MKTASEKGKEREGGGERGESEGGRERGREREREREGGRERGREGGERERVLTSFSRPFLQHPSENYKACPSICIETVAHHTCDKLSEEREWALH